MTAALVVLAILVVVLGGCGALLIRRHQHHLRRQPDHQPSIDPINPIVPPVDRHSRP